MSQQSGITVSPQLRQIFAGCNDGHIRMIKMTVSNEQVVLDVLNNTLSSWENDWNKFIGPSLVHDRPCYILYRLDTQSQGAVFDWVFLSYCPDSAPIKLKMLHASTKAALKRDFGEGVIKADLFGTMPSELSLESYRQKLALQSAPKPLTPYEEDLVAIREQEFRPDIGATTKQAVMKGVSFPITDACLSTLRVFAQGRQNFVIMAVNINNEEIDLDKSGNISNVEELGQQLPQAHARFALLRYLHNVQGQRRETIIFIYYVPASGCPIKERMLCSACKKTLVQRLDSILSESPNNVIAKSIEIDSPAELTPQNLNAELGVAEPTPQTQIPTGGKPAPPGRGPRRIVRNPDERS